MSIWEKVQTQSKETADSTNQLESQESNRYLDNQEEALRLIAKFLESNKESPELRRSIQRLDHFIHDDFRRFVNLVNSEQEIVAYQKILQIKEKVKEINRISLLAGKNFLAVGGGFSSGKSKFINSIIGDEILPEDQTPTTSIPTYIINSEERLSAFTFRNKELEIDIETMRALSHAFYEKYKLSFSKIIKNIIVQTPKFPQKDLVLLDTPGYTKAESFKQEANTDQFIAQGQLRIADYIIWLMDIENGTVTDKDIEFLSKLGRTVPILFVFNKADKKPLSQVQEIVEKSKLMITSKGLDHFAVTAYSSLERKEYTGEYITQFLQLAGKPLHNKTDLLEEFTEVLLGYESYFDQAAHQLVKQSWEIRQLLHDAIDIQNISELADLYSGVQSELRFNHKMKKDIQFLRNTFTEIIKELESYTIIV